MIEIIQIQRIERRKRPGEWAREMARGRVVRSLNMPDGVRARVRLDAEERAKPHAALRLAILAAVRRSPVPRGQHLTRVIFITPPRDGEDELIVEVTP